MRQASQQLDQGSRCRWPRCRWSGLVGLVCACLVALLPLTGLMERWELRTHDLRFRLRGPRPTHARIVVAAISDDAVRAWPEPSALWGARYAQMVDRARALGVEWIGLDVIPVSDVDQYAPAQRPTARLAEALQRANGRVVLSNIRTPGAEPVNPAPILTTLEETSENVGFVDLPQQWDETVRECVLYIEDRGDVIPSFAALLAARARGLPPQDARALRSLAGVWNAGPEAPSFWINWTGSAFPEIPAEALATGSLSERERELLSGAVVLVGTTHRFSNDVHRVPTGGSASGVQVQGQALATLLDGAALRRGTGWQEALAALLLALVVGVPMTRLSFTRGLVLVAGAALLWLCGAMAAFALGFTLLPVAAVLLALVLPLLAFHSVRSLEESFARLQVEAVFGRYVSAEVRDWLLSEPSRRALGGEEAEASILFVDIRGFTAYAEDQAPAAVMRELNAFFAEIVPAIDRHHGLLFQYTGDGLLAAFGVPYPQEQHAQAALDAAAEIVRAVTEANAARCAQSLPAWSVGCSIHSGPVACGSLGVTKRSEFTVVGDTVNMASRLQEVSKALGHEVLLSDATYQRLRDPVAISEPIETEVRGHRGKVRVYGVDANRKVAAMKPTMVGLAVLAFLLLSPAGSRAQPARVGQVLRATGKVEVQHAKEKPRTCTGLEQLGEGDVLVVRPGASAIAVLYANGARFALAAGSKVRVGRDGLKPLSGKAPAKLKPVSRALVRPLARPSGRLSPRFAGAVGLPRGGPRPPARAALRVIPDRDRSALSEPERLELERLEQDADAAREADPADPSPELLLAQVYERLGLREEAVDALEAALRLGPNPGAEASLRRLRGR